MLEMLVIWVLVPCSLILLCVGVGAVFSRLFRSPQNFAELVITGFLGTVIIGSLIVLNSRAAKFAPLILGLIGLGGIFLLILKRAGLRPKFESEPAIAGALTYFLFSLPSINYGKPTWAGWVQLDDNSSWYAITNRLMSFGHSIPNPILTTYDRVLQVYLGGNQFNYGGSNNGQFGYPTGALVPFGTVSKLSGVELAWLFQPYLALCAGLTSMLFVFILRKRISKNPHLIFGAVLASSASTYFSYAMWGGIKEIVLVIPITYFAFTFFSSLSSKFRLRNFTYSLLSLVSLYFIGEKTSFAFVLPMLVVGAFVIAQRRSRKSLYISYVVVGILTAFALYSLMTNNFLAKMVVPSISDSGNLYGQLNPLQMLGIWPSHDFRLTPIWSPLTFSVILLALALVILGTYMAAKRREWTVPALLLSTISVFGFSRAYAGVWLTGKAIAVASPVFLMACVYGMNELRGILTFRNSLKPMQIKVVTVVLVGIISSGVVLSDFMTYRNIWFAPNSQIDELRAIGHNFAGQGPTLMTEYSPYGARYFLREIGAEAASELRVHVIPMRDGNQLPKGASADIDLFSNTSIDYFNLLVLRRSAQASRPPLNYSLAWTGINYEVWKRNSTRLSVKRTLVLGTNFSAGGVPTCDQVTTFLADRAPKERIFTVPRESSYTIPLGTGDLPIGWSQSSYSPGGVDYLGSGALSRNFSVSKDTDYQFWISGSFPGRLQVLIDGQKFFVGKSIFEGNNALGNPLGKIHLSSGVHLATVIYTTPLLQSGSQVHSTFGPIMLTEQTAGQSRVESVTKAQIPSLCQRNLDWIAIAQ